MLYARLSGWLTVQHLERRIALVALLFALPSLAIGMQSDDYILREQVIEGGPFAAYQFTPRQPQAAAAEAVADRAMGYVPWWTDEQPRFRMFRPLTSLSLWLDFTLGAPPWWMHVENCLIFAAVAWLGAAIYRQLGLTGAGLGWAALFLGLDMGFAVNVGWLAARNTLLAAAFGLACILLHERARQSGRVALLAAALLCFALSLLSGELGMCALGYVAARELLVDRAPLGRRALALSPYAVIAGVYLAHYVAGAYGVVGNRTYYRDVVAAPGAALLGWLEALPVWLATTATSPIASLLMLVPDARVPILVFSVATLALLVRLLKPQWQELPAAAMCGGGAVLSLVPLATVGAQDRLHVFVALGVFGLLGPWVASSYDATERLRRRVARVVWRIHSVWSLVFFVPMSFGVMLGFAGGAANALDEVVPRAASPITIALNAPSWTTPWYIAPMRAYRGEPRPPLFTLYAGSEALEVERPDANTLELHAARGWLATPFERIRDLTRAPFHRGDRLALMHLIVEVREVNASGAPTRAQFTFDRPLDDAGLTFRYWTNSKVATWAVPPIGSRTRLPSAAAF